MELRGHDAGKDALRQKGGPWLKGLGLMLLVLVAYLPALQCTFIWDDDQYVLDNTTLRDVGGLVRMWTQPRSIPQYYPLTHTTFWVEYHLWGDRPLGYHATNMLLHACSAILVWRVLQRMKVKGAWVVAGLFAVHPMNVESVAWVTERKNVLAWFFYFAAFLAYWRMAGDVDEKQEPRFLWRSYLVVLALFLGALLSKTTTCTLPAALALTLWWKRGRLGWREIWPLLPMLAIGAGFGAGTAWLEQNFVRATGPDWAFTFWQRVLIAGRAICFYAGKCLLPLDLSFVYPRWHVTAGEVWQWIFPAGVGAVLGLLLALRGRIGRGPLVAALFFCGSLFPALGFFNIYPMLFSFVADHFAYSAILGMLVLMVGAVGAIPGIGNSLKAMAASVAIAACAMLSFVQCFDYYNVQTLWNSTLERNPHAWIAANNLATYLLGMSEGVNKEERKRIVEELEPVLTQAMIDKPSYAPLLLNMGQVQAELGNRDRAIECWTMAMRPETITAGVGPSRAAQNAEAAYRLGEYHETKLHDSVTASSYYDRAIKLDPKNGDALHRRALLHQRQGEWGEAAALLRAATKLRDDVPLLWCELGDSLLLGGHPADSLEPYGKARSLKSGYLPADCGKAMALAKLGRLEEARELIRKLAAAGGRSPEILTAEAVVQAEAGDRNAAVKQLEESLKLEPEQTVAAAELRRLQGTAPRPATP